MSRGKGERRAASSERAGRYSVPARRSPLAARLMILAALAVFGCRQKMANQPRYDPLEPSDFFADGMSARPRVPGTVARGELAVEGFMATGKINGADGDGFPFAVDANVLNRGEEGFKISCRE